MEKRSFEVSCPHCGAVIPFEDRSVPESREICPHCRTAFFLEAPVDVYSDSSSNSGLDAEEDSENSDESDDEFRFLGIPAFSLIVILVCVVFLLAAVILFLLSSGRKEDTSGEGSPADPTVSESDAVTETRPIRNDRSGEESLSSFDSEKSANLEDADSLEEENDAPPNEPDTIEENRYADFAFPSEFSGDSPDPDSSSDEEQTQIEVSVEADDSQTTSEALPADQSVSRNLSDDSVPIENSGSPSGETKGQSATEDENFDVTTNSDRDLTVLFSAMSRSLAEPIDPAQRLGLNIRQITLARAGLADFIRLFYQLTGIPVQLGWRDFPTPVEVWEKRIPYVAANITASQFLDDFSTAFHLDVGRGEDRVILTDRSLENDLPGRVIFDCSDLIGDDSDSEPPQSSANQGTVSVFPEELSLSILESALRDLVLDQTLLSNGKSPTLEQGTDRKSLVLSADQKTIENASLFFDRLRSLRHLPQKRIAEAEILIPETLCWENYLSNLVSLSFLRAVPLSEALLVLERGYQIHFFFDYAAIPDGGRALETPVRLMAKDQPMEQVLSELIAPLGLKFVVLTEDLLAVTSGAVDEGYDAEIHFYATPDDDVSPDEAVALADRICKSVVPESWQTDSQSGGKIWIDPSSHSFYIRQTISSQFKIRRFLQSALVGNGISL